MNNVEMKVPGARKVEEFVVYPFVESDTQIKLQSINRCVIVVRESKEMYVSRRFARYPRFEYCAIQNGGKKHPVPEDILELIESKVSGSKIVKFG